MITGALRGMTVTLRNFFRRAATVPYPEERGPVPERFRGRLFFDPDICTGCLMCEQACPNGALEMVPWDEIHNTAKPQDRDVNLYPQVDIAMCTYCGWCEDVCPTTAIRHTHQFELARTDREHFAYTPEMLAKSEGELLREPSPEPGAPVPVDEREKERAPAGVAGSGTTGGAA